jgi:16S rRNA (uracil1498-N3)-methyltransferase
LLDLSSMSGRVVAHAVVADVEGDRIHLDAATHRHFSRVLRLRSGEIVTVTDGSGGLRRCRIDDCFAESAELVPIGQKVDVVRPTPMLGMAVALTKGEKPEFVVQKLTELGIDEIVLFPSERSVVRWANDKVSRNLDRLRLVAKEALQQSRGVYLPKVSFASDISAVVGATNSFGQTVLADAGGGPPTITGPTMLLIGPEGGWTEEERTLCPRVAIATTVLRAETAAVVGAALMTGLRSGLISAIA